MRVTLSQISNSDLRVLNVGYKSMRKAAGWNNSFLGEIFDANFMR